MKNYKENVKVVKKQFESMICDSCGAVSESEEWEDYKGNDYNIRFSIGWCCQYDACEVGNDNYDICPDCAAKIEKLIKSKMLGVKAAKYERLREYCNTKAWNIFNDLMYRFGELDTKCISDISYDDKIKLVAEIHAQLLEVTINRPENNKLLEGER